MLYKSYELIKPHLGSLCLKVFQGTLFSRVKVSRNKVWDILDNIDVNIVDHLLEVVDGTIDKDAVARVVPQVGEHFFVYHRLVQHEEDVFVIAGPATAAPVDVKEGIPPTHVIDQRHF